MTDRKVIVLDRDGVINEDSADFIKSPAEFSPLPGSIQAIARLKQAGFTVVIATNQSGLGRGLFNNRALLDIHDKLIEMVEQAGGALAGIYVCPHKPEDGCDCRKPKPGLLLRVAADLEIDATECIVVGDSRRDLEAALAVGARAILVRTGNGRATEGGLASDAAVEVFDDLSAAAQHLTTRTQ